MCLRERSAAYMSTRELSSAICFFIWLLRAATGMKVDNPLDCFGHCCNRHMELLKYSAGRYVQQDGHATKLKMRLNIF